MRYYFAGSYVRRRELRRLADALQGVAIGAKVVSSWLDGSQADDDNDAGFSDFSDPAVVALAWKYGQRDLADLGTADAIVSFTGQGGRGGRHIEHGVAIEIQEFRAAMGDSPMRLIVVGPREHVFHCHPATEHFASWTAFLAHEIEQYREESK
jgi:hypothetical protein